MARPVDNPATARTGATLWGRRSAQERKRLLAEFLVEISSEALQGDSLETVMKRIVDCVVLRLPVTVASIILLDEKGTHFSQEVGSGDLDLTLPASLPWPIELGAAGRCARTGQAQLIVDVDRDPDYVPGNSRVRSEYLVPIRHRDHLHGVLNLESIDPEFFTPQVCATFDAIAAQIAGAVHLAMVVRELELANRTLEHLSMRDGLTGIANRRSFDVRLAEDWQRHAADARPLALLLVDVDCFKRLNDAHGHLYGDECLRELATHCALFANPIDGFVARFGGEEFAILLTNCELRNARRAAQRLRRNVQALAMPHAASEIAEFVTVSVGVSAMVPRQGQASDLLVAIADRALYKAKNGGRNRVVARSAPNRLAGAVRQPGSGAATR